MLFWNKKQIIPTKVSASLLPWNVHVDDHGSNLSLHPIGSCHEGCDDSSDDQDLQGLQDPTSSKGALPRNNSAWVAGESLRFFQRKTHPEKMGLLYWSEMLQIKNNLRWISLDWWVTTPVIRQNIKARSASDSKTLYDTWLLIVSW